MAVTLHVTAQAKRDAGRIIGHIAKDNPPAAGKLAAALERGMLRLLDHPLIGPAVPNHTSPDIRQLIIPPCRVLYRASPRDLYILGILRCEQSIEDNQTDKG